MTVWPVCGWSVDGVVDAVIGGGRLGVGVVVDLHADNTLAVEIVRYSLYPQAVCNLAKHVLISFCQGIAAVTVNSPAIGKMNRTPEGGSKHMRTGSSTRVKVL